MKYSFHPAAETEHLESVAYYESKRPGLGAAYLTDFEFAMINVCETPHRYAGWERPGIRKISMKRFPFDILYRENQDEVQVLAVAHKRRRPLYWARRL